MTFKKAPELSVQNNTLETVNYERVKVFRRALAYYGHDLEVPDDRLVRYLSDISPELFEVHLLGSPEELMPSFMPGQVNRQVLYLSGNEKTSRQMERLLIEVGMSEANLIASMRAMMLFLGHRGQFQPHEYVSLADYALSTTLKERAIYLAGQYDFRLPSAWTKKMPREQIAQILLSGIQDKSCISVDDASEFCLEEGISLEGLEEDVAYMNRVHERETTFALKHFFRRNPEPTMYTSQLLDLATFRDMMQNREESGAIRIEKPKSN